MLSGEMPKAGESVDERSISEGFEVHTKPNLGLADYHNRLSGRNAVTIPTPP
jgi:hypothetical protein